MHTTMYFWNSYPFVRYAIALILGILIFEHAPTLWSYEYMVIGVLVSILLLLFACSQTFGYYKFRTLNGFFTLFLIGFVGGFLVKVHYYMLPSTHYKGVDCNIKGFSGIIIGSANEKPNYFRYEVQLRAILGDSVRTAGGKIHLYIKKDSLSKTALSYGDVILVSKSFYSIPDPENPKVFNYKTYLKRQQIYAQAFTESKDVKVIANKPPNQLMVFAFTVREQSIKVINQNIPEVRENAISKALLLGIKDALDNDTKQSYASAGAMHVLAVSGLHVGIFYLILQFALGRLRSYGKYGKWLFGILSCLLIWGYALITGMSPSVMRSATMFSILALSRASGKESNLYNTLGIAAFILLCINPYFLYSVGFQLSFAAVFGIAYFQPRLYQLIKFNTCILDKAWSITCVSIAAQIATFPLSAYYFHQFPTYFFVSNLLVIPCATIILVIGICMLIIAFLNQSLTFLLGRICYGVLWLMNEAINGIEGLPLSLIEWIYLDDIGLIISYGIIFSLTYSLHFSSFKAFILCFILSLAFLARGINSHLAQAANKRLIFYQIKNHIAIDHINGHQATLYVDDLSSADMDLLSYQINPYRLSTHLPPIQETIHDLGKAIYTFDAIQQCIIADQKIIIIDSTTFHLDFKKPIETDILIISNSSIKSMKWLNEHFTFQQLILSSRNSRYYSRIAKKQGNEIGLRVHSLVEEGALKMNLN